MKRSAILLLPVACLIAARPVIAADYDPLKTSADAKIVSMTLDAADVKKKRTIPIRVYLPESKGPAPVILFSHGLGGSRDNNPYLGNHWAKRGYVVVFMQHAGSDESVWKDAPAGEKLAELKKAVSLSTFLSRIGDVPAVIDALAVMNADAKSDLHGRMDLEHIGMSGHSYGAVTTQAMVGENFASGKMSFADPRIDAAVMMSPSPPVMGDAAPAFAPVKTPCLLMTGTEDDSPVGDVKAADRLKVFPALANAPVWQVVFDKAVHMSFGQRPGVVPEDTRYHRAILALSTAFWDAELKGDKDALKWLNGKDARTALAPEDKWEMNAGAKAATP